MRKIDIEFVAGFVIGRYCWKREIHLVADKEFEEFIQQAVDDALGYLDSPTRFEADVMKEIEELLNDK